jgi:hypothetical protein
MTTKQTIDRSGISPKLANSVLRQLGGGDDALERLADVRNGGADAGFCGFTYYKDTVPFFKRNRAQIVALVESMASDLGEEPLAMVAGFRCLDSDPETKRSIAWCLYGGRLGDDDTYVANALAWFALEEVARAFEQD